MIPTHEEARLNALYQLKLLDTPSSESFDRITRMASQIFGLPIAAISLTDQNRQWFKSRVGVTHDSIPRMRAPCAEVAEATDDLIIPDLLEHPCYSECRLADDGVRFYAGAPLVTREGFGLGALCVLGTEPRVTTEEEMAALRDLAAMVMAQIELQHAFGRIDPVSGLPNRNQFMEDLDDLALDGHGERRMAVLVDLARHEEINTIVRVLGAVRVDEMVRESASALSALLGVDRTPYHVGATQFVFLSPPDVDEQQYMALLAMQFGTARATSSARFVATVALGVLPFTVGAMGPVDVLRGAHSAVQDARKSESAIGLYSPASDRAQGRQVELIQEFGAALEAPDQLRLVFQPRIALKTGRCGGAEALLRWCHPVLGEISPGEFIPLIEQTPLVRATTAWVMEAALKQLGEWQRAGLDLVLSVNVSAANLDEDGFVESVQLRLLKHGVRPEMLEIEVTESAVMTNTGKALICLEKFAAAGISIAIDDFGAGHSSLAYLQKLPVQVVKIDQSFVRNLTSVENNEHILVSTMITLSHRLGYQVVAEGIETAEAAAELTKFGCEEGQGYHFARPMEAGLVADWVAARHAGLMAGRIAA
jgi:EAL domain-containing protein (putative c-di-GMP-specific phosphodiesterase class I)/GGDEF domain-containing protein